MERLRAPISRRRNGRYSLRRSLRSGVLLGLAVMVLASCTDGSDSADPSVPAATTTMVNPSLPTPVTTVPVTTVAVSTVAPPAVTNVESTVSQSSLDEGGMVVTPDVGLQPGGLIDVTVRCDGRSGFSAGAGESADEPYDAITLYFSPSGSPGSTRAVMAHPEIAGGFADVTLTVPYWLPPGEQRVTAQCGGSQAEAYAATVEVARRPDAPEGVDNPWQVVVGPWAQPEPEGSEWDGNRLDIEVSEGDTSEFAAQCSPGVDTTDAAFYLWTELVDDPETHRQRDPFVIAYAAQRFVEQPGGPFMVADIALRSEDLPAPEDTVDWPYFSMMAICTDLETPFEPLAAPPFVSRAEQGDPTIIRITLQPAPE